MIWTDGQVLREEADGTVIIRTRRPPRDHLSGTPAIGWQDGRTISLEQRRRAWALIGEIAAHCGYIERGDGTALNAELKAEFLRQYCDRLTADAIRAFSLSDADMETATLYNTFLTDFVIRNDIPTRIPLAELAEDIDRYICSCLMNKKCCVCGKPCDLHHVDAVGIGRDRTEIVHEGMEVMPLCREHHTECHTIGQDRFNERYHLQGGIPATKEICRKYRLKTKETTPQPLRGSSPYTGER